MMLFGFRREHEARPSGPIGQGMLFFLQRQARLARSTHRVTSPFSGPLRPEPLHVH